MFAFFIIIIIAVIAIVIWQQFRDVFYRISEIERRLDFLGRKIATDTKATSAEAEQVPVVSPETIPPSPPSHELPESESIILASILRSSPNAPGMGGAHRRQTAEPNRGIGAHNRYRLFPEICL